MLAAMKSKLDFFSYRLSTVINAFKALYTLPPEKVDAFLNSYEIYNHDWVDEKQLIQDMGTGYVKQVQQKLVDYYSVLNHLCTLGQVEKMYIPPAMDLSKSIIANQVLFEKRMCQDLNLGKDSKVLDIGCGRGRVVNHMATLSGARVTGVNIDDDQLNAARKFAAAKGFTKQTEFKKWDLNDLPFPFPDHHFDAIYHIQVFTYSKDLLKMFKELHRMMKPGGKFGCLDWMRLPKYNSKDPYHADLMKRIKPLIGAIGTPSIDEYAGALKEAGFDVLINENASIDGLQAPLIDQADVYFTRLTKLVRFFVKCKILPDHFNLLLDRLTKDGQAFVEADRARLVTTSHYIVAQKKK